MAASRPWFITIRSDRKKQLLMDSEIIIVGGGLAGTTLAALLGRQGVHCIVLEARAKPLANVNTETGFDPRTLAITLASANILRHAGAWSLLAQERIGHFRRMQVWDAAGGGEIEFDSAELCETTLGYIIEQSVLESTLQQVCAELEPCTLITGIRVEDFKQHGDSVTVSLDDGRRLTTRLLVAADGASSNIRQLAGISWRRHDYRQQAVAGIAETVLPHEDTARQRFLSGGPLAFLPMAAANRCGFVWTTATDHARKLLAMDENTFNHALSDAFGGRLGQVTQCIARAGFPLQHAQAGQYCQPRLALIGDAAHVIHPLAGQGANMGLLDAAVLAQVVLKEAACNRDPGAFPVLRRYERWRKGDNYLMLRVLQGMNSLFASRSGLVRTLRNTGLELTDMLYPIKHSIMRHAMGLSGDLPDFARRVY